MPCLYDDIQVFSTVSMTEYLGWATKINTLNITTNSMLQSSWPAVWWHWMHVVKLYIYKTWDQCTHSAVSFCHFCLIKFQLSFRNLPFFIFEGVSAWLSIIFLDIVAWSSHLKCTCEWRLVGESSWSSSCVFTQFGTESYMYKNS